MRPRSHLAIYECVAYITDMSCDDSRRAGHRQRQARYEARMREGVGLFPTPLRSRCTVHEIASISGHATLKEVERYTKAADQQRLAHAAMARTMAADSEPRRRKSR